MASIEEKVISAVLRNKDPHTVIGEHPEIFGTTNDVIEFIRKYYMKYKEVPTEAILTEKFEDLELPSTDGPTNYYVNELKQAFVDAHLKNLLTIGLSKLEAHEESPAEVLDKISAKSTALSKFTSNSHDVNMTDFEEAISHIEREKGKSQATGIPGIPTGFDAFDCNYPTGLAGGHSIVLLGFSGKGKSFFSAELGVRAWSGGRKVMVVSLEMNPSEYRNRVYPMMSKGRFTISEMGNASVDTLDIRRWGEDELKKSADFIVVGMDDTGDMTPNKIQSKIDMYKPDLVIIDYLQLMTDNRRTEGMTPRMLNLSREIKMMAMQNDIPIISITAVTDDENSKRESAPTLKQIAWSRGIEYDANLAIAVHRFPNTDYVHIVCRKNRIGDEFAFYLKVDFDHGIWEEAFELPEDMKEKYA